MGYRILYEKGKHPWQRQKRHHWGLLAALILCFAIVVCAIFSDHLTALLPGDPEVTAAALENMKDSLKEGDSFGTAVLAFCQEVLRNAHAAQ